MKLFVYGSLKRKERLNPCLEDSLFLGVGKIKGILFDLGAYPAAIEKMTDRLIEGEIYEVSDRVLRNLDQIEGNPNYYIRKLVKEEISSEKVWVYFMPNKNLPCRAKLLFKGVWKSATLSGS